MPTIDAVATCPVRDSFRVRQVAGLFDLPIDPCVERTFRAELPSPDEDWRVGAVVGPSGSGKSTIVERAFPGCVHRESDWPIGGAVVDGFAEGSIRQIVGALTAVGFASPPSWLKPYSVLSTGEKFRCDLARAVLDGGETVVFDEFTSVVDRTAAKIASAAVSSAVRKARVCRRFVAVACHYDILEWLEPDWVLDMATGELSRRRLRRPGIELAIFRCGRDAWRLFGPYHYLSGDLHHSVQCHVALWEDRPVALAAVLPMAGKRNYRRVSRLVVLPDFQGVGIGSATLEAVCELYVAGGTRIGITTGHPGMIRRLWNSSKWMRVKLYPTGRPGQRHRFRRRGTRRRGSLGRCVASFRYRGEPVLTGSGSRVPGMA